MVPKMHMNKERSSLKTLGQPSTTGFPRLGVAQMGKLIKNKLPEYWDFCKINNVQWRGTRIHCSNPSDKSKSRSTIKHPS